jgi:uncharacterized protein (DUF1800 family)
MDPVTKNLRALQGALEHSLTIQRARVQEIVDDLVSRGTLSRTDADGLLGQLLASSKDYSQALLQVLDSITSETRKTIVMATAGKIADTVMKAPALATKKPSRKPAKKPAQAPKAAPAPPADPLPGLSDMTVAEIKPKLSALNASALRRVRERELAGKARKTVIGQIDQLLGAKS